MHETSLTTVTQLLIKKHEYISNQLNWDEKRIWPAKPFIKLDNIYSILGNFAAFFLKQSIS